MTAQPLAPRWMPFLLVLGLMGLAARQGFQPIGDPDTWWHLRLGDELSHTWNFTDPAPWTRFATEHWVTTQWLPELVANGFEHLFGLPGVVWLTCAGFVLIAAVLYVVCWREADVLAAAVATLVAFLGMSATLTPRPQLVSFILLLIVTSAWLQTTRDLRPRRLLIPVSWLWACSHGMWFSGVVVGAVVVVGLILDRRIRGRIALRMLAIPVSSLLVAAVTPAGPGLLLSPFTVGGAPAIGRREVAGLAGGVLACLATAALLLPGSKGTPANVPNALATALDERLQWQALGRDAGYVLLAAPR